MQTCTAPVSLYLFAVRVTTAPAMFATMITAMCARACVASPASWSASKAYHLLYKAAHVCAGMAAT